MKTLVFFIWGSMIILPIHPFRPNNGSFNPELRSAGYPGVYVKGSAMPAVRHLPDINVSARMLIDRSA